ncbi:MAG TPA: hypothetical protein VFI30_03090 [Nocardioidaceae bacterium]|nr:hypothetical protein [Nocardioidaceae bacterium]
MLVAASVCPPTPLLVPAVSAGAAAELADLREACLRSVAGLAAAGPDRIVSVGSAEAAGSAGAWDRTAGGTLHGFGVDAAYGGASLVLPPALTIAAYLLDVAGWEGERRYVALARNASAGACEGVGAKLSGRADSVALLTMGDGSAKRGAASPGYLDPRAEPFDATVVAALAGPDPAALLGLDAGLAAELWSGGRAPWQALAGAALHVQRFGAQVSAEVRYDAAPFGVGYFVVDWVVRRA